MSADKKKILKIDSAFKSESTSLMAEVGLDAWARIQAGEKPYKAFVDAMKARRAFSGIESAVLKYARDAMRVGWPGGITASDLELDKFLLRTSYAGAKIPLIKLIDKRSYMGSAKSIIDHEMKAGYDWQIATRKLANAGIIRTPNLPKYLQNAVSAARRATKSPQDVKQFEKTIRAAQAQVDKLARNGAPTTHLKQAYQSVLDAAKSGSVKALEKAIKSGVTNRIAYEAQRIARTEGFAAYGQARVEEAADDPDISALKFTLNSRHHHYDQCDIIANSNLYGLGAGVYPVDKAPRLPIHPNGMSYYSPVSVRKVSQEAAAGAEFDRKKWEKETARRGLSPSQSQPPQETKLILSKEIRA